MSFKVSDLFLVQVYNFTEIPVSRQIMQNLVRFSCTVNHFIFACSLFCDLRFCDCRFIRGSLNSRCTKFSYLSSI